MAVPDPSRDRPKPQRRHGVVLADFAAGCLPQARLSLGERFLSELCDALPALREPSQTAVHVGIAAVSAVSLGPNPNRVRWRDLTAWEVDKWLADKDLPPPLADV